MNEKEKMSMLLTEAIEFLYLDECMNEYKEYKEYLQVTLSF
jgi:hypothetical protein